MKFNHIAKACLLAAGIATGFSSAANAGFYSDRTAWEAAVTGLTTVDFQGIVANSSFANATPSTTIGGVNFALGGDSNGLLFLLGDNYYYPSSVLSTQQSSTGVQSLVITLPGLFGAIGVDFGTFAPATVNFSDATPGQGGGSGIDVNTPDYPSMIFFGYVADVGDDPIGAFKMTMAGSAQSEINIDNLSFANVPLRGVPEPVTLSLFGAGIAGVVALRRRRKA